MDQDPTSETSPTESNSAAGAAVLGHELIQHLTAWIATSPINLSEIQLDIADYNGNHDDAYFGRGVTLDKQHLTIVENHYVYTLAVDDPASCWTYNALADHLPIDENQLADRQLNWMMDLIHRFRVAAHTAVCSYFLQNDDGIYRCQIIGNPTHTVHEWDFFNWPTRGQCDPLTHINDIRYKGERPHA